MKITDIFKNNSNEKKLVEKLEQLERPKIDTDMSRFAKFERMRQTWNYENRTGLYFKIKNGEYITEQDIKTITDDAKDKGVYATKEFNIYLDYLNQLKGNRSDKNNDVDKYKTQFNTFVNFGKEFINGFKSYKSALEFVLKNNWIVTKKEQEGICDIITKIQLKLSNIGGSLEELKKILSKDNFESEKGKTYYLKLAQEVQEWMYGKDNFYQKGAQKVFYKYKDVYEMILNCKKEKLRNYVQELKLDDTQMTCIFAVLEALRCLSIESYNKTNKYSEKVSDIEEIFM